MVEQLEFKCREQEIAVETHVPVGKAWRKNMEEQ